MQIVARCPLKAASLLWHPRAGATALTLLCKATFELRPGRSRLAAEQDALSTLDTYADDARTILITASDMCPFKRRADVLFNGHAYAPSGHQAPSIVVRLIVGKLDKSIEVHADRGWNGQQRWSVVDFRPVAPSSPLRAALLGRHAKAWDPQTWNTRPLPDDFDGAFFNAAPVDQQIPELTGDEIIALEHLSPVHPRLVTRLSRIVPRASVQRENRDLELVRLRCDTLSIDGDRGVASLVFRGLVPLSHPDEPGLVTITTEAEKDPQEEGNIDARANDARSSQEQPGTMILKASQLVGAAKPAVPFVSGAPAPGIERGSTVPLEDPAVMCRIGTGTGPLSPTLIRAALPFHPSVPERPGTPPASPGSLSSVAAPELEPELPRTRPAAPEAEVEREAPIDIPPPPMFGPLLVPARPAPGEAAAGVPSAAAAEEPAAAVAEDGEAAAPELPPIELSIEQVAAIAAEIAERRQDQAVVLHAHGLRERAWSENQQRWTAAIEEQASRGSHALRAAYDAAYVAQVEQLRGAITPEEYARILLALDRRRTDETLDALKIQRPALMPIVRMWTRALARDATLADAVSDALRAAQRA
ncbi:hypothetical protein predicted by Glimmer/Critica [Sorangium cellulosum So ce56]|uniref:DUF2169 domain-containing protein n=1 Tax=Sorangium cellulosum (strain So ce56) TaxID=448385 RepID=A9FMD1_SORC5|nr:DUF2169 domain-containing protein [Sorangium cellulosum]CAN98318.1 hypothetical protein predicted by Glimmer/Critica [Sorangium cellulosum So ce56]